MVGTDPLRFIDLSTGKSDDDTGVNDIESDNELAFLDLSLVLKTLNAERFVDIFILWL